MRGAQNNGIRQGILQKKILLIDRFLYFFAKGRKSGEKTIRQKNTRGHRTPRSFNAGKATAMVVCPHCSFEFITSLARCMTWRVALPVCAVTMCKTISANVLNIPLAMNNVKKLIFFINLSKRFTIFINYYETVVNTYAWYLNISSKQSNYQTRLLLQIIKSVRA